MFLFIKSNRQQRGKVLGSIKKADIYHCPPYLYYFVGTSSSVCLSKFQKGSMVAISQRSLVV